MEILNGIAPKRLTGLVIAAAPPPKPGDGSDGSDATFASCASR